MDKWSSGHLVKEARSALLNLSKALHTALPPESNKDPAGVNGRQQKSFKQQKHTKKIVKKPSPLSWLWDGNKKPTELSKIYQG